MIDHFTIHEVFHDHLRECEEGESFTLWTRPEAPLIYAYRDGTIGGQGKVVTVNKIDNPKLVKMMDAGWVVDLTLIQKGERLKFQLTADPPEPPELVAEKAAASEAALRKEVRMLLTSPYRPVKRELNVQVRSREGRRFRVGESMSLPLRTLDQRLEKQPYEVRFVGETGTVGWVTGSTELRQRILRAQFSGYEISAVVTSLVEGPVYTGDREKYWAEEQCAATVFFNKEA